MTMPTEDVDALVKEARERIVKLRLVPDKLSPGVTADLLEEISDALEALRRPGREEIAREIDPIGWDMWRDDAYAQQSTRAPSLAKADAILALFSPAPQQREG